VAGQNSYPVYRFACGHVGRDSEALHPKAQAFIRVAEIRGAPVEDSARNCPDCK
jgi:hypothetical protein